MSPTATSDTQQASFENSIDARSEPLLAEHRIGERCVLPAAAQVDMALSAYELLVPGREITLGKVAFQAPIEAPGDGSVEVRLVVDASGCQLWSRPHAGEEWRNAMQATVESRPLSAPVYRSVVGLHARCPQSVAPERVREWYQVCGIAYGPTYRTLRTLALGTNTALALLSPTMPVGSAATHRVHPSILDGAFQALAAGILVESGALRPAAAIFMPWYLRAVLSPRPFQGPVLCAVEWEDPAGAGELVTGNCWLLSQQGEVLLELQGMTLKRVPDRAGIRAGTVPAVQPRTITPVVPLPSPYAAPGGGAAESPQEGALSPADPTPAHPRRPHSPHKQRDASSLPADLLPADLPPETDAAQM
ncbi:MAG: polyketide synthase dehydratase domain-containing protein, partial [Chloroflexi bacterium]|nr:polyketide synthase dehydratase domain-containing protein [Chloroflexota bacterium]